MRRQETVFIVGFIVINLIGPIVLGERFPFTISPMFCDEPACYCEYFVTDANGREIDLASLKLQRVYDGNPVGLGVGIQPAETLDRFGQVPTEQELSRHLLEQIDVWPDTPYLRIEMTVVGALDENRVGPVERLALKVERP
ncbi:MAG: hypothetical protein VXX55_11595 [Planctomycetota bacterium]|nr:hypothetical protein [Pirellulaceae bacterium]MEC7110122.1 hypothetical protein [Planctomycetota bacterium]MEC8801397.1 hypothetical protein [Planctomycetota bacterium]